MTASSRPEGAGAPTEAGRAAEADFQRGNALWSAGAHEAAIAAYATAIARDPGAIEAHTHLGNAFLALGRPADAAAAYRAGIAQAPARADLHYNLANALLTGGDAAQAEAAYRAALALCPGHAGANNNLGTALRAQARHAEALGFYRAALRAHLDSAGTLNNIASTLLALHRPDEAVPLLERAIALQPGYGEACNNLGGALLALDRPRDAIARFDAALHAEPGLAQARLGKALALLSEGDFVEGWRHYEARWDDPRFAEDTQPPSAPLWSGGPVAGRRILLQAEQGLGDTLQFVRYAPLLRARGAHVILQVPPPLAPLLAPLADESAQAGALPPHDLRCPLMSLPHAFGTTLATIPALPYLRAPPSAIAAWRDRLGPPGRPRIGIAFSGNPDHPEDALRSIPAARLIAALPGAELHILQPDIRPADRPAIAGAHRHTLRDFADTAALLCCMDFVVSVDTAIAHLAGALGHRVLVLLQFGADFRWLRGRTDSPWYPSMHLLRQSSRGDWAPVLRDLAQRVQAWGAPDHTARRPVTTSRHPP